MTDITYTYIVFGSDLDYYKVAYGDLLALNNVKYIGSFFQSEYKFVNLIHKIHLTPKINRYIDLPFKYVWNPCYFDNKIKTDKPFCFLFFRPWLDLEKYGLISYLRNKYPDAKFVCYFHDLFVKQKGLSIDHIKDVFDLVIDYDKDEAEKFGFLYYPISYSRYPDNGNNKSEKYDVCFVGLSKDRLPLILSVYNRLVSWGLKCRFYISGVKKEMQIPYDGIYYVDRISYYENLNLIRKSKCILEIMQEGAVGFTLRTREAVMYDKKLLTNNRFITESEFYDSKYISVFGNLSDISREFFSENEDVRYKYKERLSPVNLLSFIDNQLK